MNEEKRQFHTGDMPRWEIINALGKKINAKDYLEVGVSRGRCVSRVNIENKVAVDPKPNGGMGRENVTHVMTSDEFFADNDKKFDVIFIDGLHTAHQTRVDILNALEVLNDVGYIVCHDMNPAIERAQANPPAWNGDCWKAWVRLRQERSDLDMFVVDTDEGCGVISKAFPYYRGLEKLVIDSEISYKQLEANRKEWLNLISVQDFLSAHG